MASIFDLSTNPFHLLAVSVRTTREDISEAFEDALVDGQRDENTLNKAQQALLVPRSRIDAEVSWLSGLSPAIAKGFLKKLTAGEFGTLRDAVLSGTKGLDRANLSADLCCRDPKTPFYALHVMLGHLEFGTESLIETLNASRKVSGFNPVDSEMLRTSLANLRRQHAKAAMECIKVHDNPGYFMTMIVNQYQDGDRLAEELSSRDLMLTALAREYDAWSAPDLRRIKDAIDAEISVLRAAPANKGAISNIERLLNEWDAISQPIQLIEQHKGHDEERSYEIYGNIRELLLWLANEKNEYEAALTITTALAKTFPELPTVALQTEGDIQTLKGLAANAEMGKIFAPLDQAVEFFEKDYNRLLRGLAVSGFNAMARGDIAKLYVPFAAAVKASKGTEYSVYPWRVVRNLAYGMYNAISDPHTALTLINALLLHDESAMPAEVEAILKEDQVSFQKEQLAINVKKSTNSGQWRSCIAELEKWIALEDDPDRRSQLHQMRQGAIARRDQGSRRAIGWGVAAAVIGGFILLNAMTDNKRSTYTPPSQNYDQSNTYSPAPTYSPSATTPDYSTTQTPTYTPPSPPTENYDQAKPPVGTGQKFSIENIRYCLYQKEMMIYLRPRLTTDPIIDHFNSMVDDYNSRCSNFQYYKDELSTVQAEVVTRSNEIHVEADAIYQNWEADRSATPAPQSTNVPVTGSVTKYDITTYDGAQVVQHKLQVLGYYSGIADGSWGPASKAALRAWKRANNMPDNDSWDDLTEQMLMGN